VLGPTETSDAFARAGATTEPERRAQRLGFALRSLAAELVDERRKVARLRQEVAQLTARLESLSPGRDGDPVARR